MTPTVSPFARASELGSAYPVELPVFQGPLDLLLQLIERQELDISEISLVAVTDRYLQTLELLEELEPGSLADFLLVASRLLFIKSRMLLPKPAPDDEDEEDEGDDLLRQLLDYKRFKEVASQLRQREEDGLRAYIRTAPGPVLERHLDLSDVDLGRLHQALQRALERMPTEPPMPSVRIYSITVAEQIENVRSFIDGARRQAGQAASVSVSVPFTELLSQNQTRVEVIVTFLAVLELIKQQELEAVQEGTFGEISLRPAGEMDADSDERPA